MTEKLYRSYQVYEAWVGNKWDGEGCCKHFAAENEDAAWEMANQWSIDLGRRLTDFDLSIDEAIYVYPGGGGE